MTRPPGMLEQAPRVVMGGRQVVVAGGDVPSIPNRVDGQLDEVPYVRGEQPVRTFRPVDAT